MNFLSIYVFRIVFQKYDPNFMAASLDEAYLDITTACLERGMTGEEVSCGLKPITLVKDLNSITLCITFFLGFAVTKNFYSPGLSLM